MNKIDILKKYEFYNNADPSFKKEMENASVAVKLKAGDPYFYEGDQCKQIALIGNGGVRVYKAGESGREITLYHVTPGETCILSVSCFLGDRHYPANGIVESDTEAVVLDSGFFRMCIDSKQEVRKFVFSTLAIRLTDVLSLLEEITFNRVDHRLSEYLLKNFTNGKSELSSINRTHEQIAMELGTAREVISRLLKEHERIGAIKISRGMIVLKDKNKL
ncbi:MAG: Crp/Fnr family transcriptional regulator [Thermodesulfobacteriota bacterium]